MKLRLYQDLIRRIIKLIFHFFNSSIKFKITNEILLDSRYLFRFIFKQQRIL